MAGKGSNRIHTPEGTARYCSVFVPRVRKDPKTGEAKGDPKYQITLIFDEDTDLSEMEEAAKQKGIEKFGPKFMALVEKGKMNWPFRDNADRVDDDDNPIPGFDIAGVHVGFKTGDKPGVVDEAAEPIMDKSEIYDGCRVRVSCRPFAYDNESKGVAFALVNVQKLDDGDRLSGDPSAEDDFKPAKKAAGKKTVVVGKKPRSSVDDALL